MFTLLSGLLNRLFAFLISHPYSIFYIEKIRTDKLRWDRTVAGGGNTFRHSTREYILYPYCLLMVVRYLISSYVLSYEDASTSWYFKLDIVMEAVYIRSHFDKYAFLLSSFLLLYAIAIHYQRNFCTNKPLLDQQYKIIYQTLTQYWSQANNAQYRINFNTRNFIAVFLAINRNIKYINAKRKEFKSSSNYSKGNVANGQRKLVCFILKIERINIILFVFKKFLVIATAVGYLKFALKHRKHYHFYQLLFLFLDRAATMSVGSTVMHNKFTGIYILIIIAKVYGNRYGRLYKDILLLLKQLKFKQSTPFKLASPISLSSIRIEHTLMSGFVNNYNSTIASQELYAFFLFNLGFNIYTTMKIVCGKPPQMFVFTLTILQAVIILTSAIPMIRFNELIHKPAKYLPNVQEKYNGSSAGAGPSGGFIVIREKLKLQRFYEQISHYDENSRIGLTVGPLGTLTRHSFVKFVIFYFVYAIFSCSIIYTI